MAIDWPAAAQQQTLDAAKPQYENNRSEAGDLGAVELPVLLVGVGPVRSSAAFMEQGTAYAATYAVPSKGLVYSIFGSATAIPMEDLDWAGDATEVFSLSEDGADLSFTRYGAAYTIRVACEDVDREECRAPDYLQSIRDALIVAGGAEL